MARIFNIYFEFNNQQHNAVVSVRPTPFHTEYILNNFNDELLSLLPGNRILSRGPEHFVFSNAAGEGSRELMDAIIRAVAEHMHTKGEAVN